MIVDLDDAWVPPDPMHDTPSSTEPKQIEVAQ